MTKIKLSLWAKAHGVTTERARQLARQGRLPSAGLLMGEVWVIDEDEPYPEEKKRGPKSMSDLEEIKKISRVE
jgi:hypothetical protein